jgi:hypothetical protein
MLDKNALKQKLIAAVQSGSFPENAPMMSAAIASYVKSNGTALPPTITYTLAPCDGTGWRALIPEAISSKKGISDKIISMGIAAEFAGSTKKIPASHGTHTVPMSFNTGARVPDLSNETDFDVVWDKISQAIIDFFKPEII